MEKQNKCYNTNKWTREEQIKALCQYLNVLLPLNFDPQLFKIIGIYAVSKQICRTHAALPFLDIYNPDNATWQRVPFSNRLSSLYDDTEVKVKNQADRIREEIENMMWSTSYVEPIQFDMELDHLPMCSKGLNWATWLLGDQAVSHASGRWIFFRSDDVRHWEWMGRTFVLGNHCYVITDDNAVFRLHL